MYKRVPCTDAFDCRSVIHTVTDKLYISESLIPYDYKTATVVFFLSGANGDEFGQFSTLEKAQEAARSL